MSILICSYISNYQYSECLICALKYVLSGVTLISQQLPMIKKFIKKLWFSDNEYEVLMALYKTWTKPASAISKITSLNRTTVYKILEKLETQGVIQKTKKWWVTQFFVADKKIFRRCLEQKAEKIKNLEHDISTIEAELEKVYYESATFAPQITVFDGIIWIENLFADLLKIASEKKLFTIKHFASHTSLQNKFMWKKLGQYHNNLYQDLSDVGINVDTYLWHGKLHIESILKPLNASLIWALPASNDAIHMFVAWDTTYQIIFREIPYWIKIRSQHLADLYHFFLERMESLES